MNYRNPTPLQIGMTGTLSGKQYRVVGRAVLGEAERGAIYYWNEFNLESDDGEEATLVFEQTERGDEWRLFRTFEPAHPLTAAEAVTKRLGDPLNLDGTPVFVRFLSTSRVYAIEGKAPEGVKVGDVAHYFNANGPDLMIVVSWTGDEVEFYEGTDLAQATVASAFNVRIVSRLFPRLQGGNGSGAGLILRMVIPVVLVLLALAIFAPVGFRSLISGRRLPAVIRTSAPPSKVLVGKSGALEGTRFKVQSHFLVEMALVGREFDRHEYVLSDENGSKALLVCGTKPGAADWWLFTPFQPQSPLSPQQAAAVLWGQTVKLDDLAARADELFQSSICQAEGPEAPDVNAGEVFFGFAGTSPAAKLLVRWNASYINFFQGHSLLERDVLAAFGQAPSK